MKRVLAFSFTTCAAFLAACVGSGVAWGQMTDDVFSLVIEGPSQLSGSADQTKSATLYPSLQQEAGPDETLGNGAQGWSYGISINENITIESLTFSGTVTDFLPTGFRDDPFEGSSFNKTVIIDPLKNGGKNGMVSAVALTTSGNPLSVLPATGAHRLYQVNVVATIPAGGGVATLVYEAGLVGEGQPVALVVTQDGVSANLVTTPLSINLVEVQSCCDEIVNVGFSETIVRGQPTFTDIVGMGELCTADQGEIVQSVAEGATLARTICTNIVSNLDAESNVQGWSFGIELEGTGEVTGQSAAGTAADFLPIGFRDDPFEGSSFNKTQVIEPAKNGGKKGLVSAVALTTSGNPLSILPPTGTETVLCLELTGEPQGPADQVNTLSFEDGLIGAGQPVALVVTVNGESADVCNFLLASVDVVFRLSSVATFRRGNANNDVKVDIADAIWILNELVRSGPPTLCQDAADANDDGAVDPSDAVFLINYQFQPGAPPTPFPAPSAPFPDCGPDPTEDTVGCDQSQSSCS